MRNQNHLKQLAYRQGRLLLALALLLSCGLVGTAAATTTSTSPSYSVTETQFGSGGSLNDCSSHFCSKSSVGDTSVGRASSTSYSAQLGSNTTDQPLLEVAVTGGVHDMGTLSTSTTGTATSLITVRTYLSSGYIMQIIGGSPTQGSHSLSTITTPSTSHQGAEQFGINLVANTAPAIGADPVQVPSGSTSFGMVTSDYSNVDNFKYANGDIVAESNSSSGETDYTVSMIINVSNVTPGGRYNGTFAAVVVPTF